MSKTSTTPLRTALRALLPAALCFGVAHAEPIEVDAPTKPGNAYPGDHVGVPLLGSGRCNSGVPDPARKPQIRLTEHLVYDAASADDDVYTYAVDYWLVDDPLAICGTPPPPGFFYADIGELPIGHHRFNVALQDDEDEDVWSYEASSVNVRVHDRPGNEISGIWFAPDQSGRGFSVTRSGAMFALYWATHDAAGQANWVTLLPDTTSDTDANKNTFGGTAINTSGTPLAAGSATLVAADWGTVEFSYEGCGRATFTWDAVDPEIGDGSLPLRQVAVPDGIEMCDVSVLSDGLVAEWLDAPAGT